LNGLVDLAIESIRPHPELRANLLGKLGQRGYSPADRGQGAVQYRVVEESLYKVSAGFPRLTRHAFAPGLPQGVMRVSYDLDMSACGPWRADATADTWPPT
jgi:hypothetical protein